MRTFIAIEFEEELRKQLSQIQTQVKLGCKSGNFTNSENFHLTLHFLGETKKSEVDELAQAVSKTALQSKEFPFRLQDIGFFTRSEKQIIWVGIKENKNLVRLVSNLEKNLEREGFPRGKRAFQPHITLCREAILFYSREKIRQNITLPSIEFYVKSISLMESVHIGAKLVYRPLFVQKLKPKIERIEKPV